MYHPNICTGTNIKCGYDKIIYSHLAPPMFNFNHLQD